MGGKKMEVGSEEYKQMIMQAYNEQMLKVIDLIEGNDFYGVVAERGVGYLAESLGLIKDSHILDLCSGIGGPARFLAKKYGCKVTGVDINEFSYQVAQERTKKVGLDHLVDFINGNALEVPFPDHKFTHVFGCDAWSYFPDKLQLYKAAYRVLKPNGLISFLDMASDIPVRFHYEEYYGQVHPETIARYTSLLESAGFDQVQHHDTTDLACKDILSRMYKQVARRDRIIASVGSEAYFMFLELWAEILTFFSERKTTHCCFIAKKK